MSKLFIRTISGLVYAGIIVGCLLWGINGVILLGGILAILASLEFTRICGKLNVYNIPTITIDIAGCLCLVMSMYGTPLFIWILIMMIRFIEELYMKADNPLRNLSESMMCQIYIGMPMAALVALGSMYGNPMIVMLMFLFIWINDSGAFLVGCTFGKHRLFERISPKKSWEGFYGGLALNIVAAILFCQFCSQLFGLENNIWLWIGFALTVTVFGTWGDLVESMLKRTLHIKDSGNVIPGHGGILDRIDSMLLAAPASLLYIIAWTIFN